MQDDTVIEISNVWKIFGDNAKAALAAIRAGKDLPAQARIELTRFARHQSAFVLEGELSPEVQTRLLYHLGRAYKDDYLVPSESDALDVVLRPRRNRIIGVSREGAASISWMESGANEVLEVYQWPAKFLDFYLYLHIHVLSERIALSNCAYELARGAEKLGVLELAEEDLALCQVVDPSKIALTDMLRTMLTTIEKES